MIQCYFSTIFFILFIFSVLRTLLFCNALLFNTLYYFIVFFLVSLLKNTNFFRCFGILHPVFSDC